MTSPVPGGASAGTQGYGATAMELCDWNPVTHDFALTTRKDGDCENVAALGLRNGEIHLCEQCAELPEFAKYRKRIKLMPSNVK